MRVFLRESCKQIGGVCFGSRVDRTVFEREVSSVGGQIYNKRRIRYEMGSHGLEC